MAAIAGLFSILAWVVLLGLQRVWRFTFGWLFTTLADLLDKVNISVPHVHTIHAFGSVSAWLRSLDKNVSHLLAVAASSQEHAAVWLFSRVGHAFGWLGRELGDLAGDVFSMGWRILHVIVPRLIRKQFTLLLRPLRALIGYAHRLIPQLTRRLFRFSKWATHKLLAGAKHLGFLFKWAKAAIVAQYKLYRALWKRLTKLEHFLVPKKFRGLVSGALQLLGLQWLFGANIATLASWVLGFNPGHLREYVTDAVQFAGNTDICKLAAYQFDLAVFVFDPVMQSLIGLTEWVCYHSGETLPSATKGTGGYAKAWAPSATPPIEGLYLPERQAPGIPLPRGVIEA